VNSHVRNTLTWPLRWLGVDAGRALANARPNLERDRRDRFEQFAYIAGRHASGDELVAVITPDRDATSPDELSIVVFDGAQVVRHHATLDSTLRESIGSGPD
jgi:hypothetical protein